MVAVKVRNELNEEIELTVSSDDVKAQVLATRELARQIGRLATRPKQ